jgi:hypothetical protein
MIIENTIFIIIIIIIVIVILNDLGLDRSGSGSTKDLENAFVHFQPSTHTLYRSFII